MSGKVLACQQSDGLWRASLLDPASYPLKEASGSGFFTYALAWGVNQGVLERARFEPAVRRAWTALAGCVGTDGRLEHVQPIGADPKAFAEDSTEVYGVGAFLLAGSEVYRLGVLTQETPGGPQTRSLTVTVTNPATFYREQETVELDPRKLGLGGEPAVMDGASSRVLASQAYASEPGQPTDKLLFQVDIGPRETRSFRVIPRSALAAVPRPLVKTYARKVAERFNDFAWESDRIAHRMYQQALIPAEGTVSSGIDVWTKRTRALIVDEWYARRNYHEDDGDGLDDYHVSRSRGCGGLGIWSGGKLHVSSNYSDARIITTGPIRSEFELTYDAWEAGGHRVSERKRISIDAGYNFSRAESTFESGDKTDLQVGVGIAVRAGDDGIVSRDKDSGWMTYWQAPDRDRGSIGCAVVLTRGSVREFVTDRESVPAVPPAKQRTPDSEGLPPVANLLAITQVDPGKPLVYFLGAGWSRSGDFPDEASWVRYVRRFTQRRDAPLVIATAMAD
jgi:hypothetical protein